MSNENLLAIIAADVGQPVSEMLEFATYDSVSPGICTECHSTFDYIEPDAREHRCEWCETPTVKSALVLAGLL